eukprot:scaffold1319_cov18-Tisochrysis_lutea.AAC.1
MFWNNRLGMCARLLKKGKRGLRGDKWEFPTYPICTQNQCARMYIVLMKVFFKCNTLHLKGSAQKEDLVKEGLQASKILPSFYEQPWIACGKGLWLQFLIKKLMGTRGKNTLQETRCYWAYVNNICNTPTHTHTTHTPLYACREGEWGMGKALMEAARRRGAALTITELRKAMPAELPKYFESRYETSNTAASANGKAVATRIQLSAGVLTILLGWVRLAA